VLAACIFIRWRICFRESPDRLGDYRRWQCLLRSAHAESAFSAGHLLGRLLNSGWKDPVARKNTFAVSRNAQETPSRPRPPTPVVVHQTTRLSPRVPLRYALDEDFWSSAVSLSGTSMLMQMLDAGMPSSQRCAKPMKTSQRPRRACRFEDRSGCSPDFGDGWANCARRGFGIEAVDDLRREGGSACLGWEHDDACGEAWRRRSCSNGLCLREFGACLTRGASAPQNSEDRWFRCFSVLGMGLAGSCSVPGSRENERLARILRVLHGNKNLRDFYSR